MDRLYCNFVYVVKRMIMHNVVIDPTGYHFVFVLWY